MNELIGDAMTAAYIEGRKARQKYYGRNHNPYNQSRLRAAWNRGWDAENHRKAVADAAMHGVTLDDDSTDHHQHSWNLAEALSEIVRGEVEKQVRALSGREERTGEILARELGPSWMDRIEALEERISCMDESLDDAWIKLETANQRISDLETTLGRLEGLEKRCRSIWDNYAALEKRISETEHAQDQDRDELGRQIQGLRELVDMQIERAATRVANLQQDLMDTNTHLATANERIADLETTLIPNLQQQLVKIRHAQNQNHGQLEEKVQIVRDLIDAQTDREATRLANIQKRLSEILVPRTETIERLKGLAGENDDSRTTTPHEFTSAVAKLGDLVFGMKDQSEDDEQDSEDERIRRAYEEIKRAILGAKDTLDEHVTWYSGKPPAAGPWKEGPPPDHDMNKWLVTWGEHVFLLEQVDDQFPHIAHHARINLPETESED